MWKRNWSRLATFGFVATSLAVLPVVGSAQQQVYPINATVVITSPRSATWVRP